MPNYLSKPNSHSRGGIILLHAWWGLNDFIKIFSDSLANEGFVVLAPDLYEGKVANTIPEAEALRKKMSRDEVANKLIQATEELTTNQIISKKPVGLIGFSLGAHWSLWLTEQKPEVFTAGTLFYGTRTGNYTRTKTAFLGHFAKRDTYVAISSVKRLEKSLKATTCEVVFHIYNGESHWFFESDRPEFSRAASELAWSRTIAFLDKHIPSNKER